MPIKCYFYITFLYFFYHFFYYSQTCIPFLVYLNLRISTINQPEVHRVEHKCRQNGPIFASCKIPEFFENSPLSRPKKHPDFQVTLYFHFVTTNVNFAYTESG